MTIGLPLEQVNTSEAAGTVEVCVSVLNGVLEREVVLTLSSASNGESNSLMFWELRSRGYPEKGCPESLRACSGKEVSWVGGVMCPRGVLGR